jgi:hypothetical protein
MQTVYLLRDPITREARYVGVTGSVAKRLREHRNDKRDNHRCNWIQSVYRRGLKPLIEILDVIADRCRIDSEQAWILGFRQSGVNLVNATNGGEGTTGHRFSDDHRAKLRAAKCRMSPDLRSSIASKAARMRKGYKHSSKVIEEIRMSNLGKSHPKHTEDWKREQSIRSKRPENIEHCRQMIAERWRRPKETNI